MPKPTDEKPATPPKSIETTAAQLDKAKTETNEAARSMQDYAYAERAEFVDKMKNALAEVQVEMDRMSTEVEKSGGAAKADAETKLAAVREKWAQANRRLDQAETAAEPNWNDVKDGLNQSYADLKNSYEDTRQWLSDKIEP
jgi:acyl-CoA reductase-like NAD-dependent aldehyde dehydrogenase